MARAGVEDRLDQLSIIDFKTRLQEVAAAAKLPLRYDVLASKGRLAPVALAAHRARGAAADRRDAALTAERGAEAAVAEHGMRLLRAAVDAWERTEEE